MECVARVGACHY